ncbi:MAG TPA: shikimate dehydrogenase [Nevskiaceae bacterium]|nr:shikimate dehydrogenase [Nevskiaceae bacterium]
MDRYAVLGHPVAHSLSPRIHTAFAQACGVELSYTAIDIEPGVFATRVEELREAGYRGFNVTLPHKRAAAALAQHVADRARLAGAANTLIRSGNGWTADNTDGIGLIADLTHNLRLELAGLRVAVIGSGGAARGILAPLLATKPGRLVLANRSPQTPQKLAQDLASVGTIEARQYAELAGQSFDLVINATSAGHQGLVPELPDRLFRAAAMAYDLNYGPAASPFLGWAEAHGAARTSDGLGMLVEQAAESFLLWRGVRPRTAPVLAALRA